MFTHYPRQISYFFRPLLAFILITLFSNQCLGQNCPLNIDFELGDFTNWVCSTGSVTSFGGANVINVSTSGPVFNRHTIVKTGGALDPYGHFSTSPPDGSGYAIKLGNDGVNAQAERVSYTFTIPQNQPNFVLTYQYAVVLQDPGHSPFQQPRFTAKVYDVDSSNYITCGSFDYVATASLPGFVKAGGISNVIYKNWTAVTLNLTGYQGKTIKLEFTTADCTLGAHFGYAYVDVNSSCSNLIQGTNYCIGSSSIVLKGPAGFQLYTWYNSDRSKILGTSANLSISPPPPDNTNIILDVTPYQGYGCPNSIYTTIHALPGIKAFNVFSPPLACSPATVDLTSPNITLNSDTDLQYSYWKDSTASVKLTTPNAIAQSGIYYIKATKGTICYDIKPVNVNIGSLPNFKISNPGPVCAPSTVDLTDTSIVGGSNKGLTFTYWQDSGATMQVNSPHSVNTSGTYYIKGTNQSGCSVISPVNVAINPLPVLLITNPAPVWHPTIIDLTAPAVTAQSSANLIYTYYTDSLATQVLPTPNNITQSGTFYIKATNSNACSVIKPVKVLFSQPPVMKVTDPAGICAPGYIDITDTAITSGSLHIAKLGYYTDINALLPLANPKFVTDSGQYFIKATNADGLFDISPVNVKIHKAPVLVINTPHKRYKPQTADITAAPVTKGSSAALTFTYWQNPNATISLTNPKAIGQSGTYYIKATNAYGCFVIAPVNLVLADIPDIKVPTAFTPTQADNKTLYPFLIGIKTFNFFRIYNKWGNVVFQTGDAAAAMGWDGSYKGQPAALDTYTWVAEGVDYLDNLVHRSGNTLLLK